MSTFSKDAPTERLGRPSTGSARLDDAGLPFVAGSWHQGHKPHIGRTFEPARHQRGDVMLEALVGVLVAGLLGAGFARLASGVLRTQHDAKVQNVVVQNLRSQLQTQGVALCGSPATVVPMPGGTQVQATVTCTPANVTVSVGSATHPVAAPRQIALSVSAAGLGTDNNRQPLQMATGATP